MVHVQVNQFLHAHARVVEQAQQCIVPLSLKRTTINAGKHLEHLLMLQVFGGSVWLALERNSENALSVSQMTRVNAGQVIEEGMDGCQPGVSSRHTVFADALQVIQKATNGICGQVFQGQGRGGLLNSATDELQKELQRIPVGQHGMTTEATLGEQVLLEEPAKGRADVTFGHGYSFGSVVGQRSGTGTADPRAPT